MAYNKSPETIQRMRGYLDAMASAEAQVIFLSSKPKTLSYALHEAVNAAKHLAIPKYKELGERFKIEARKDKVICTLRKKYVIDSGTLQFDESDWMEIITILIKNKDVSLPILFPNAKEDINLLETWCKDNGFILVRLPSGIKIERTNHSNGMDTSSGTEG